MDPPVAEAAALAGDGLHSVAQGRIVRTDTSIAHTGAIEAQCLARLTLAHPDLTRAEIVELALRETKLSPCELAVRFTDEKSYFVSEASLYRRLKAHDLIASPIYIVIKAASEFRDKTTAPNQLWQTDFTT